MKINKKFTTVTTLSKTVALILFVSLPFIGFYVGSNYKNTLTSLYKSCVSTTSENTTLPISDKTIIFQGTIKQEKAPGDLQLGDYYTLIYFDEPYLLEDNASGKPAYTNSMQVYEPLDHKTKISDYVGKHVELTGTLTWGYAESRVIQAISIKQL